MMMSLIVMVMMPMMFAPILVGLQFKWFFNAQVGLVNNIISIIQQLYMRKTDKGRGSVYVGTAVASVAIFGVGFLLTLI